MNVEFKFAPGDRVVTPFGEVVIIDSLLIGDGGKQASLWGKGKRFAGWVMERDLRLATIDELEADSVSAASIKDASIETSSGRAEARRWAAQEKE